MPKECEQYLATLYLDKRELLQQIRTVIAPQVEQIADRFYRRMMDDSESMQFLDHELVNERLHASMGRWLESLFGPENKEEIADYIAWQREIGRIHARINIPVRLITKGMRVLKQEINNRLRHSDFSRDSLADALITINELLDILIELLNQSYLTDSMEYERHAQSLRMDVVNNNLAIECERLRSNLFDWQRQVLFQVYNRDSGSKPLPDVQHSSFCLWVTHKAELLFPDDPIVSKLSLHIEVMEQQLETIRHYAGDNDSLALTGAIEQLNSQVTHASWLLSSLVEELLSVDNSRDPLTRMLNRRYMSVILQRETEISIKHDLVYAALFLDIDHFKRINDEYGHETGDKALRHFAEQLNAQLRSGDFIFRYGGEEFLIILSDTSKDETLQIAERLRLGVESTPFTNEGRTVKLTTSIGVALHDGHPDYTRVLNRADEALYRAKQAGRNRVEFASHLSQRMAEA